MTVHSIFPKFVITDIPIGFGQWNRRVIHYIRISFQANSSHLTITRLSTIWLSPLSLSKSLNEFKCSSTRSYNSCPCFLSQYGFYGLHSRCVCVLQENIQQWTVNLGRICHISDFRIFYLWSTLHPPGNSGISALDWSIDGMEWEHQFAATEKSVLRCTFHTIYGKTSV